MSLPLQKLFRHDIEIIHRATQVRFNYIEFVDGKEEITDIGYDSWVNKCAKKGPLVFDLVVKDKKNVFKVLI